MIYFPNLKFVVLLYSVSHNMILTSSILKLHASFEDNILTPVPGVTNNFH